MTTFSIASILGEQIGKHEAETSSFDEQQQQLILSNSVQHLYNVFCKNAAVAAHLTEQHHSKTNLMRSFPLGTSAPSSNDFYQLHKLNTTSYQGNYHSETIKV
jgi:hypothetical protein